MYALLAILAISARDMPVSELRAAIEVKYASEAMWDEYVTVVPPLEALRAVLERAGATEDQLRAVDAAPVAQANALGNAAFRKGEEELKAGIDNAWAKKGQAAKEALARAKGHYQAASERLPRRVAARPCRVLPGPQDLWGVEATQS